MGSDSKSIRINANAVIVKDDKILVIEFQDENGIHYNLPGGGVDVGESLEAAVKRESFEEACAEVTVGRLLVIWEYVPELHDYKYGKKQKVGHIFECQLVSGCVPMMPKKPDKNQTNVKWIPLSEIKKSPSARRHPLFPEIGDELIKAIENSANPIFVQGP